METNFTVLCTVTEKTLISLESLNPLWQENDIANLISQMKGFAWLHLVFVGKRFEAERTFQQCQASVMKERLLLARSPT